MDKDNILITGGNGMIGKAMKFGIKPSSNMMNINDYDAIKKYVIDYNIKYIIHLAAINLRESESSINNAINININGTANVVRVAKEFNIPVLYMSSGAVFSSSNCYEKFNENSVPSPNCNYGITKLSGEKIVSLYDKGIIVRTGWVFGGNQKTHFKFIDLSITNLLLNKNIYGSIDFVGSPIYVNDLVDATLYLLQNEKYGLYHVVNEGHASGYEIGLEIARVLNKDPSLVIGVKSTEVPNSGPNRSNSEILVSNHSIIKLRNWKLALIEYIESLSEVKDNIIMETNSNYSNRTFCRLCNSENIRLVFELEPTPFANNFVPKIKYQECIPLNICKCISCEHIQLEQIINPKLLFENYYYTSSASTTMVRHLQNSLDFFINYLKLNKSDTILEIGSNDGVCIKYLIDNNFTNVIGIDPAKNIKLRNNLPIICEFFGSHMYNFFNSKYNKFKLIFGFHCCAHIENIQDVFNTIFRLLDDDGVFIMEVGYFYQVYKNKTFDTIYHEHIDYYTCTSINNYCNNNNLMLFDAIETNIQGGSIQFYICKKESLKYKKSDNIDILIKKEEENINFDMLVSWITKINGVGEDLYYFLKSIKNSNKKIAGYGASAKSTTFMYYFGLSNTIIDYIIDDSIYKINHYSPGLNIPIKSIDNLEKNKVDYIIILSWNFKNEIIEKLKKYVDVGLKVIIPFPNIQVI